MTSERQYIIPSQHYGSALPVSEGEAGRKALGLFDLPASWVPPFFVLTVSGTETLLQAGGTSSTGRLACGASSANSTSGTSYAKSARPKRLFKGTALTNRRSSASYRK